MVTLNVDIVVREIDANVDIEIDIALPRRRQSKVSHWLRGGLQGEAVEGPGEGGLGENTLVEAVLEGVGASPYSPRGQQAAPSSR